MAASNRMDVQAANIPEGPSMAPPAPDDMNGADDIPPAVKQSQRAVRYKGKSDKRAENCANCENFLASDKGAAASCTLVDGRIDPEGICDLWEPNDTVPQGGGVDQQAVADQMFGSPDMMQDQ